jgi:hypothetical protein
MHLLSASKGMAYFTIKLPVELPIQPCGTIFLFFEPNTFAVNLANGM